MWSEGTYKRTERPVKERPRRNLYKEDVEDVHNNSHNES